MRHAIRAWLCVFGLLGGMGPLRASEFEAVEPERVGLSSEKLDAIGRAMRGFVDRGELAGMVTLVARHGRIAYFEAAGWRDIDDDQPMTRDTIFRLYSMTKPVTNVAAMTLRERGDLELDDPVARFIPEFEGLKVFVEGAEDESGYAEPSRPMTIRDLMRHTSGLTYGVFGDSPVDRMYRRARILDPGGTLEDMTRDLAGLPLRFEPGTRWHYSVSTDVLARVVEVASGMPFDRYLREAIFEPLGMDETGFSVPEEAIDRFATNYRRGDDGGLQAIDRPATSRFARPATFFSGGGGLVGTTLDYWRFLEMLRNGGSFDGARILDAESVREMTRDQLSTAPEPIPVLGPYSHGLGFGVLVDDSLGVGSIGEYQWGGAASTIFWVDPAEDLVVIVMAQFMPSGAYPLRRQFKGLVHDALIDDDGPADVGDGDAAEPESTPGRRPLP